MKFLNLGLLLFILCVQSFAQITQNQAKVPICIDSVYQIVSFIKDPDCKASTSADLCYFYDNIPYKAHIFISGVAECNDYNGIVTKLYKAFYKHKLYYIPESSVFVKDYTYSDFEKLAQNQKELLEKKASEVSDLFYEKSQQDLIKFVKGCAVKGLCIQDYSVFDVSEYTEGTGFTITVDNPSKKTIKYLKFNISGYNQVDDIVKDYVRKSKIVSLKAIGPIEPLNIANYKFEYAWFTDLVETVKINSINITYMDGSTKTISNIKSITVPEYLLDNNYGDFGQL